MICTGIRRLVTWQWFDAVISKLLLGDACSSNLLHTFKLLQFCPLLQNTGVIVIINIICAIVFAAQVGEDGQ